MHDINLRCHFYRATFGNEALGRDGRRLKLLAAEDVAYPRSRRSPVSHAQKRVYALMLSLFLGVVIVVVVVVVFVVGDSVMTEMTMEDAKRKANEEALLFFQTLPSPII